MCALRAPAKQSRAANQVHVQRSENPGLSEAIQAEKGHLLLSTHPTPDQTSSTTTEQSAEQAQPTHPKGHKSRSIDQVWDMMNPEKNKNFLRLTDTPALYDVWVQPKVVTRSSSLYLEVTFCQIIAAPHMHYRDVKYQVSADDLLKMFYLADQLQWAAVNAKKQSFDDWLTVKVNKRNSAHGLEGSEDRALLAEFVFNEDDSFSLYPVAACTSLTVFFRKICYHSYKLPTSSEKITKINNPSMIKCHAVRGKFEYMYEARILSVPDEWKADEEEEAPSTLPMD